MTTIAYKDGVLVTDSLSTVDDMIVQGFPKCRQIENDKEIDLYAGCGCALEVQKLTRCLTGEIAYETIKDEIDHDNGTMILHVNARRKSLAPPVVIVYNSSLDEMPYHGEYYSLGSGSPYAYGAMAQGATALEAVEIAANFDLHTNDELKVFDLRCPVECR